MWGNAFIQIWRGDTNEFACQEVNRLARKMVAAGVRTSLFIVEPTSSPPRDEVRKLIAEFSKDIVSRMSLAVVVAEGGGFRSALVRGVGITLTRFLPHRSTFQFVNNIETGARLLAPHLPPKYGGQSQLLALVEELRGRIGTHPRPSLHVAAKL